MSVNPKVLITSLYLILLYWLIQFFFLFALPNRMHMGFHTSFALQYEGYFCYKICLDHCFLALIWKMAISCVVWREFSCDILVSWEINSPHPPKKKNSSEGCHWHVSFIAWFAWAYLSVTWNWYIYIYIYTRYKLQYIYSFEINVGLTHCCLTETFVPVLLKCRI